MLRALILIAGIVAMQTSPKPNPLDVRGKHLTARPVFAPAVVAPGQIVTLRLSITPDPKIHVYAQGQVDYIPVAMTLDENADVKTTPAKYPASRAMFFESLKQTIKVYDTPFAITQSVTLRSSAALQKRASAKETLLVSGALSYQACDDQVCFVPEKMPVTWKIPLASGR